MTDGAIFSLSFAGMGLDFTLSFIIEDTVSLDLISAETSNSWIGSILED